MEPCANHPELEAVERCEVCDKPLCGLCLWYGQHGHRYCEAHAREAEQAGEQIYSPRTYAAGVSRTLAQHPGNSSGIDRNEETTYRGNSQDLYAALAAAIGLISLLSCFGGIYCLPLVGGILGALAYFNADRSIDPRRTRILGGIGMGVGGLLTIFLFVVLAFYGTIFLTMMSTAISSSP